MRSYDEIITRNDLADFLGISHSKLTYVLYTLKPDNCYTEFTIPKRNGGSREISAPNPKLKVIQKRLATVLWQRQRDVWESKRINPNPSFLLPSNTSPMIPSPFIFHVAIPDKTDGRFHKIL